MSYAINPNNGLPIDPATGKTIIQGYIPNLGLAAAGIAVFGLFAVVYLFHWVRNGYQKYMLWITLGSTAMAVGFAIRIVYRSSPSSIPLYSATELLILLSPCAFIAQDYYTLPHLASALGLDDCLLLSPRIIGRTFLISDAITFVVQAAGQGMQAINGKGSDGSGKNSDLPHIGSILTMVGLIAQCVSFLIFSCLLVYFGLAARKRHPATWTKKSSASSGRLIKLTMFEDWRVVWWAMCWTVVPVLIRCVFRVIEYEQGFAGYLRTTEGYFYLLDSLPLALAIAVWCFVWPPRIIKIAEETFAKEIAPYSEGKSPDLSGISSTSSRFNPV